MRLGVGFTPFETRTDVIVRLAGHAEDVGLDRVDVAEGWTHDSLIVLAELAARTSRIGLGTSIISVWGRTPATMALAAAGLQRYSGGRFSLGIGAGSPPLAEGFHGRRWDRPLAQLRETVTTVRALLAGDRLPEPAAGARALRMGVVPESPVPILLAALSPGSSGSPASWLTGGHPSCGHDLGSRTGGPSSRRVSSLPSCPHPLARHSEFRWRWGQMRPARAGLRPGGCPHI